MLKVAALMLTSANRDKYQARALRCFNEQTFQDAILVKIDGGGPTARIGQLRNAGVEAALKLGVNTIVHWDDDDYSFPSRIETQLAHLEESETGVTGYRAMKLWDSRQKQCWWYRNDNPRYALGTSLCYRVDAWRKHPFPDLHVGEDHAWCQLVKPRAHTDSTFSIIAEIHGANTSGRIDPDAIEWTRMQHWDAQCKEVMAL